MSGGAQPLAPWRWLGVPLLQALAATMLLAIPLRIFGVGLPEPVFPMAAAFAWAVIRPSVLAPVGVLAMGLFLDLLWGSTFGLWAVCLLVAYGAALAGRSMMAGQSRMILWVWFAGVTALAMVTGDLITMLDVKAIPDPVGVGWQFLATILLYPFSNRLIERFEDADVRFR
jgi:rod shape-determining protein MreD